LLDTVEKYISSDNITEWQHHYNIKLKGHLDAQDITSKPKVSIAANTNESVLYGRCWGADFLRVAIRFIRKLGILVIQKNDHQFWVWVQRVVQCSAVAVDETIIV